MGGSNQNRKFGKNDGSSNLIAFNPAHKKKDAQTIVSFHRTELEQILQIYSMRVGMGDWRDYAIDMLKDRAVFSIFHRASEMPLYSVEKNPKLAKKQGAYSVINGTGQVLKRGHDLRQVLKVLHLKPKLRTV